jgi:hypothetical protein
VEELTVPKKLRKLVPISEKFALSRRLSLIISVFDLSHSSLTTGIRPYVPLAIRRGPPKTEATRESQLRLVFCAWRVNNQKTVKVEYFTIRCQRQPFSSSEERTAVVRQQERVMDCACCSSVNRGREMALLCVYTWPCPFRLRTFHTTAEET